MFLRRLDHITHHFFENHKVVSFFSRSEQVHGGALILAKGSQNVHSILAIKELSLEYHTQVCGSNFEVGKLKTAIITTYMSFRKDV